MASSRAPDLRRIRTTSTYDASEIAELFNVHLNTVHNWLRAGLPVIPETRPALIYGESLKLFLKQRKQQRKKTCAPNQMYCCRCKLACEVKSQSVSIHRHAGKSLTLTGICKVCGIQMFRGGSLKKLDEYTKVFGSIKTGKLDI